MAIGTVAPSPWFTGFLDDGSPNIGGLLYTYKAGTSTPLPTYSDINLTIPNENPIVLDAAGRATIYVSEASYKYVMNTKDDVLVRTQDNVPSTQVGQAAGIGEFYVFGGDPNSPVTALSYPSGNTFDKLHRGTSILSLDSATLVGSFALEGMGMVVGGGTLTLALVNLDDGTPDIPIIEISFTSPTGERVRSGVVQYPAGGTVRNYGIKAKVSGGNAFAWGIRVLRTS